MKKWREMKEREKRRTNVVIRKVRGGIKEVAKKMKEHRN